jgi:undecaprenyl-diphosphatase
MDQYLIAAILGFIEGFTEFLPVSSTGHLIIANRFLGFTGEFANTFDVVIQMGAILSVVVYFRKKIFPFGTGKTTGEKKDVWGLWKKTAVGVIPAVLVGFTVGKKLEEALFNPFAVSVALIVGGVVLILLDGRKRDSTIVSLRSLSYRTAFMVGLMQCLAFVPGTSRSAATIIGAMLLGASRVVAAEYSFYLAIPTLTGASVYSLYKSGLSLAGSELQLLAVGFAVSFVVAYAVIAGFMDYVSKRDFKVFGYYRIILGAIVLAFYSGT